MLMMPNVPIGQNQIADAFELGSNGLPVSWQITGVLIMTCGSVFLMWLGEQIDEYGIGNGISLLIMAGIVAMMPGALMGLLRNASFGLEGLTSSTIGLEKIILLALIFVGVVVGVVFITLGQRRIPTQSAKHVRGRRVYGGTRQYMPLRVNQAGVMPIIFAQSLLMVPPLLFNYLGGTQETGFQTIMASIGEVMGSPTSVSYTHLRAHETKANLVCRLLLEKKNKT